MGTLRVAKTVTISSLHARSLGRVGVFAIGIVTVNAIYFFTKAYISAHLIDSVAAASHIWSSRN